MLLEGHSRTGTGICKKLMHCERKYINKKQKYMSRFILFILVSNDGRAGGGARVGSLKESKDYQTFPV